MKNLIPSLLFCAFIIFAGCKGGGSHSSMTGGKGLDITPDKLSTKLDPVCQMELDKVPIADTMSYNGKLYGFCNPGCREAFAAEPEKFVAALPQ